MSTPSEAVEIYGKPEATTVPWEKCIAARRGGKVRDPDLLVAFGVDPQAYCETNGYVIAERRKPPHLVLDIASAGTGHIDVVEKRGFCRCLGIVECWRFNATGGFHGARVAGDRLAKGRYEPKEIDGSGGRVWPGRSAILDVDWRWEDGGLGCQDPETVEHIAAFETGCARADTAEAESGN